MEEYGQTFHAYRKYDGCCAVLVEGGTMSRTGERYQCLDDIAEELHAAYPNLVFIGEAWWPGKDQFNLISGEFRRQQRSANLRFMIHDILTRAEFEQGFSQEPFRMRQQRLVFANFLPRRIGRLPIGAEMAEGWEAGSYGCPQALCNDLAAEGGYDGLILRDPHGTWTRGSGTTGEIVKIKRVLSFDLRVKGMEVGAGKHAGRVGALVLDFRGKDLRVGTGFSDQQRQDWLDHMVSDYHTGEHIVGKIVEIEAMDFSSDGLLREPRFKGIRFDKVEPDA